MDIWIRFLKNKRFLRLLLNYNPPQECSGTSSLTLQHLSMWYCVMTALHWVY